MLYYKEFNKQSKESQLDCKIAYLNSLNTEVKTADLVYQNAKLLIEEFHPTKDRMKNPLLTLLMGNKSVNILTKGR